MSCMCANSEPGHSDIADSSEPESGPIHVLNESMPDVISSKYDGFRQVSPVHVLTCRQKISTLPAVRFKVPFDGMI